VDERSLALYRERRAKEVGASADEKLPVIPVYLGLIADEGDFPREGVIDFADNRLNPQTGTIRVRGVFPNKDGQLTPGQFARVRVPIGEKYKGLLVTDTAIGIDQGQKYVLAVKSDNKVEYRPVKPGRLDGDLRIFPPGAGIEPGDSIIVNGVQRVRPGITVAPERVAMPTRDAKSGSAKSEIRNSKSETNSKSEKQNSKPGP
jgi:multidrug efflux pump subunit AcrA (membrane-fusion protein)